MQDDTSPRHSDVSGHVEMVPLVTASSTRQLPDPLPPQNRHPLWSRTLRV